MMSPFSIHRVRKRRDESLPLHAHEEGQLTFAASGMIQIHTDKGTWLVPPQLAAWVPPGVEHRLDILTDVELWLIHWRPEALRRWGFDTLLNGAFALQVTPFLRALLSEAVTSIPNSRKAELIVRLMLHDLTAIAQAPTYLPLPSSPAGRRIADLALADRRNEMSLGDLATRAATSERTASRLFPEETGLTLKAWRQRARIVRAMELLARGDAPAIVARDCGFATTAAFSHAFRQVAGMTPTAFSARP